MPDTLHRTANASQRLSQLIQLKQSERPDAEFWQKFEQEFRSRQISSFVRVQPLHTRLRRACIIAARKATPPVTAAGAIALTFFAVSQTSFLADSSSDATELTATPTKQAQEADDAAAIFVMKEQAKDPATLQDQIGNDTVYQINALSNGLRAMDDYQLNVTPVTFSQGSQLQTLGAQVISTQKSF